ncbi:MAG TPA: nidogen-like domain-containing protein, partial [Paracoccaceae bacterium]|nr:nidogen-like domain-containing protein [Paracoccaceae bacterium]
MSESSINGASYYTALLPDTAGLWHSGTGAITYSFLTRVPDYYVEDGSYRIGGVDFGGWVDPMLTLQQRNAIGRAITRFGEVANVNLTQVSQSAPSVKLPSDVAATNRMVGGLGGSQGFGEITLARSDDAYFQYDIAAVFSGGINFYGTTYGSIFVNTNGSISFGNGTLTYSPWAIQSGYLPMIAPFWADIDTRAGALKGLESGQVHVDMDAEGDILTVTWDHVNFYDRNGSRQNSFQIQLFDRGGGDFDIAIRYENIDWTSGDASGGTDGLGGIAAAAGITAGDGSRYLALEASGNEPALRALDVTAGNTGLNGLWLFKSQGGVISPWSEALSGAAAAPGDITFGGLDFGAGTESFATGL